MDNFPVMSIYFSTNSFMKCALLSLFTYLSCGYLINQQESNLSGFSDSYTLFSKGGWIKPFSCWINLTYRNQGSLPFQVFHFVGAYHIIVYTLPWYCLLPYFKGGARTYVLLLQLVYCMAFSAFFILLSCVVFAEAFIVVFIFILFLFLSG